MDFDFVDKIQTYIKRHELICPGDQICVGISGGADSVALLLALYRLREETENFALCAVHINHNLRGEESDADERFVAELCRRLEIPLRIFSYSVHRLAAAGHLGMEEAGRICRREAFGKMVLEEGVTKIALAHHANDQAETFLFQAARGSSLRGLAGIPPISETVLKIDAMEVSFPIIHPFLCVKREDIEQYLKQNEQAWREDRTNQEIDYSRNKLRHRVIPYLEQECNAKAVDHIRNACEDAAEADLYFQTMAEKLLEKHQEVSSESECRSEILLGESVRSEAHILQRYMVMDIINRMTGSLKDIGREHILQILQLFESRTGKQLNLPHGLSVMRDYSGLRFTREVSCCRNDHETSGTDLAPSEDTEVLLSGDGRYRLGDLEIDVRILEKNKLDKSKIPENECTKWFDYDKIIHSLTLRYRRSGDRICLFHDGGSKKLKDYMIDAKIPAGERNQIPILADGNQVWWVIGHRMSESVKVTETTERILCIERI